MNDNRELFASESEHGTVKKKIFRANASETRSAVPSVGEAERAQISELLDSYTAAAKPESGYTPRYVPSEPTLPDITAHVVPHRPPELTFAQAVSLTDDIGAADKTDKSAPKSGETPKAQKRAKNAENVKGTRGAVKKGKTGKKKSKKKGRKLKRLMSWVKASRRNMIIAIACCVAVAAGITFGAIALFTGERSEPIAVVDDYVSTFDPEVTDKYAGVILDKTDDAGESYLKDTLFVGDSNTARIQMYGFLPIDNVIGIESMGVQDVTEWKRVYFEGYSSPVTIPEALTLIQPRRIILNFGTNNIAKNNVELFKSDYINMLDKLKTAYPYADIIIQSIPPIGVNRSNTLLTMETVDSYNMALLDIALERGLTFLNVSEVLKGDDNYMRSEFVIPEDGIHISKEGLEAYFRYVRQHAHIVEDARPKPLDKIPKRRLPPAPVSEKTELNCGKVAELAMGLFKSAGYEGPASDMSKAQKIQWTKPKKEIGGGDEDSVASDLYYFAKSQTNYTKANVKISYSSNDELYIFTVLILEIRDCTENHWGEWTVEKQATCTEEGLEKRICEVCGTEETRKVEPKGHQGEWATVEVTCTTDGKRELTCTVCGEHIVEEVKAEGHKWSDWKVNVAKTCTSDGQREHTCSVCNKTETETLPGGHDWGAWTLEVEPSCTAIGIERHCCSANVDHKESRDVPALGHKWGEWQVTTPATCDASGSRTHACTRSGCTATETETIPALGHSFSDGTCTHCGAADPNYVPPESGE